jgi:hypothetical protein
MATLPPTADTILFITKHSIAHHSSQTVSSQEYDKLPQITQNDERKWYYSYGNYVLITKALG